MAGKSYSAGTIFLQVVPVFADTQRAIKREAEEINRTLGDEMERGGRKAGERAGKSFGEEMERHAGKAGEKAGQSYAGAFESRVKGLVDSAQKEFKRLDSGALTTISEQSLKDIDRVKRSLKDLSSQDFSVNFDAKRTIAQIEALEGTVRALTKGDHDLHIHANLRKVESDLAKVRTLAEAVTKDKREIRLGVKADFKQADRELGSFEKKWRNAMKGAADSLGKSLSGSVRQFQSEIRDIGDLEINLDLDASAAIAEAKAAAAWIDGHLKDKTVHVDVKHDLQAARAQLQGFLDDVAKINPQVKAVERRMSLYERNAKDSLAKVRGYFGDLSEHGIGDLKRRMQELEDLNIGVDIDASEFETRIKAIRSELLQLTLRDHEIDVQVASIKAEAEIAKIAGLAEALDGKDIDLKADVDAGRAISQLGMLQMLFGGTNSSAEHAANGFRSFNLVILAAVTLVPILFPLIATLGGALLGLVPILLAVGAAFGGLFIGASGIAGALQAMTAVEKDAATKADEAAKKVRSASYAVADAKRALADAERNAARAAEDAARQVARAREDAAKAIKDALNRQKEAQETYRQSVKDVAQAEADLREARRRAAEDLKADKSDVADRLRQNALAEREAKLAAFDATNKHNATQADGSSTTYDKERDEVAMLQSQERLREIRKDRADLLAEQQGLKTKKVSDDSGVKSAESALERTLRAQTKAQEQLEEASKRVTETRKKNARSIGDAVRNQQRAESDGARSVARAQEALRRAQESYAQQVESTGKQGSAAMQNLQYEMNKLGPAGKAFATFLFGLREGFGRLRREVQERMLPGIQSGLQGLIDYYGPAFTGFMAEMGGVVGGFAIALEESLTGPAWRTFLGEMNDLAPKMAELFGATTLAWFEGFASVLTVVAPYSERMAESMLRTGEAFRDWAASQAGVDAVTGLMEYMVDVGPKVTGFLGSFWDALVNIGKALAPWAEMTMGALEGIFDWIAQLDPGKLGLILSATLALTAAFQIAAGAVALINGGMSILALKGSRVIFFSLGLVGVLIALGLQYEWLGDLLVKVKDFLVEHADMLFKVAGVILTVMAAWRVYKGMVALVTGVQLGMAAASYGAAGATYAQGAAAKVAYGLTRLWNGAVTLAKLAQQGLLWSIIKTNAAMAIAQAKLKLVSAGTRIMAFAQGALNAVMALNPMMLLVIALVAIGVALVVAYKKIGWFRKAVDKIFGAIAAAGKWLWEKGLKPPLTFITGAFVAIGTKVKEIWDGWIFPVIDLFAKSFVALWEKAIKPAGEWISGQWDKMKERFGLLGTKISTGYKKHIKPIFDLFRVTVKALWTIAFKWALDKIKTGWEKLGTGLKWTYEHTLKPVVDALSDAVGGKKGLKSKFDAAVKGIKTIWDGLKAIFATPINMLLEYVVNKGIIAGFNKVAKFVGSEEMKDVTIPKVISENAAKFARGGVLPGHTPGRDVHEFVSPTAGRLSLSGGEAIMRPEFTQAVGSGWVNTVNAAARRGPRAIQALLGGGAAFANGGVFWPTKFRDMSNQYSGHTGIDLSLPGDRDLGMPVFAAHSGLASRKDYGNSSYGNSIWINGLDGITSIYGHLSKALVSAVPTFVAAGQQIGNIGSTGNSTGPHLHFEVRPGGTPAAALDFLGVAPMAPGAGFKWTPTAMDSGKNEGKSVPQWLWDVASGPVKWIKGLYEKPVKKIKDTIGDNGLFKTIAAAPKFLIGKMKSKLIDLLPSPLDSIARSADSALGKTAGAVKKGAGKALDWVGIGGEGGGPDDGQGGPSMAFSSGGILPYNGTMKYDAGGYLPPGLTSVVNLTGKPEPVFTDTQFKGMGNAGGGGFTYAPTMVGTDLTAADVVDDLEFTYRKMSRSSGRKRG